MHETETAIVATDSDVIAPGDLVVSTKSFPMGDILVKKATSSTTDKEIFRGFAMRKTNIPSHETENYAPGELIPIRRRGEVVVNLGTDFSNPKIGQYVLFKDGNFTKGKEGIQVGRSKDVSISNTSKVVLLDIQLGF
ncbi:structural cement protein Gp24 [Borrelia persica]|uniref:structural cement protein Gp24 n=1 Tax=Borrelia persica TaxID=44448 RepID=UPI0004AC9DC6|nr:hypothetical protein [Borrelia persica]